MDGFYIAPAFMDKLVVHITKNFMNLPNIKVRLTTPHRETRTLTFGDYLSSEIQNVSFRSVRFLSFSVSGEAKVRENPSSASSSLPRWASSESKLPPSWSWLKVTRLV